MSLVLYDHPNSSNALKVRFMLAELGLPYERVLVPMRDPRPEAVTRVHPFGTVPLLADGEHHVGESGAILRYLAQREGRTDLYPEDLKARSRVDWVIDTWATALYPPLAGVWMAALFYAHYDEPADPDGADPVVVAAAVERARVPLRHAERLVAGNGTAVGSFTIADVFMGPSLWRTRRLPIPFDDLPKLGRIRDAVSERPSFAAADPIV
jgi:glutathione S-transferase